MAEHHSRRDPATNQPINAADVPPEEKQRQLEGRRPKQQQDVFVEPEDSDVHTEEAVTPTAAYEGELPAGEMEPGDRIVGSEPLLHEEDRAGETDDPYEAAEEGMTYVPPTDPPISPDQNLQGVRISSGTGVSAFDEPYDQDHHSGTRAGTDEVRSRVVEALHADSRTLHIADQIHVSLLGDTVVLRGQIADLEDSNLLLAVARKVTGVAEVIDETHLRGT